MGMTDFVNNGNLATTLDNGMYDQYYGDGIGDVGGDVVVVDAGAFDCGGDGGGDCGGFADAFAII